MRGLNKNFLKTFKKGLSDRGLKACEASPVGRTPEERKVSPLSLSLLKRRAEKLSLPNRTALERYISSFLA